MAGVILATSVFTGWHFYTKPRIPDYGSCFQNKYNEDVYTKVLATGYERGPYTDIKYSAIRRYYDFKWIDSYTAYSNEKLKEITETESLENFLAAWTPVDDCLPYDADILKMENEELKREIQRLKKRK